MDIDKMEAGRETDALIAEKIMGWRKLGEKQQSMCQPKYWEKLKEMFWAMLPPGSDNWNSVPNYSTDIADDFLVHKTACGWTFRKRAAYFRALDGILQRRAYDKGLDEHLVAAYPDAFLLFEVGDFSRAALKAMEEIE